MGPFHLGFGDAFSVVQRFSLLVGGIVDIKIYVGFSIRYFKFNFGCLGFLVF